MLGDTGLVVRRCVVRSGFDRIRPSWGAAGRRRGPSFAVGRRHSTSVLGLDQAPRRHAHRHSGQCQAASTCAPANRLRWRGRFQRDARLSTPAGYAVSAWL